MLTEVPFDKYFVTLISICFLAPVFEELIYRGWFNFRLKKFLTLVIFLLFLFHIYDWPFALSGYTQFSLMEFLLSKFYVYVFPEDFLNYQFIKLFSGTVLFYLVFGLPFVLIFAKIILEVFKRFKIEVELKSKSKKLLIFLSSVMFYLIHLNKLSSTFNKFNNYILFILFLIPCILYPIFRLKYGLKQSIILHSLFNLSLSIIYFNEFNSATFLYYLVCLGVIGGLVWSLFKIKREPVVL
jgi:membrane protease YdiL (CAAX protease family)